MRLKASGDHSTLVALIPGANSSRYWHKVRKMSTLASSLKENENAHLLSFDGNAFSPCHFDAQAHPGAHAKGDVRSRNDARLVRRTEPLGVELLRIWKELWIILKWSI